MSKALGKNDSFKIPRGRRLTLNEDESNSIRKRKFSEFGNGMKLQSKVIQGSDDLIEEEEDSDKYGLDYLDDYQADKANKSSIKEGPTAFTSEGEMVASPVSKLSMKKKFSVKRVTRRQSFVSSKNLRLRKFTVNE